MEKMGVIRPDITPDDNSPTVNKAADCVKNDIVDNNKREIEQLDHDFRKQAAECVRDKLNQ
jgi:hypothetical protein